MSMGERVKWLVYKMKQMPRYPLMKRITMALVFLFLVLFIIVADVIPDRIVVEEGQVSDRDIIAPRTVSYVNEERTKKLEVEVAEVVPDVYDMDVSVLLKGEEQINGIFNTLQSVISTKKFAVVTPEEQAALKYKALSEIAGIGINNKTVNFFIYADTKSVDHVKVTAIALLRKYLQRGIHPDEIAIARQQLSLELESMTLNQEEKSVTEDLVKNALKPNMIFNSKETNSRKQAAIANVEPIRDTIRKGQVIARYGDVITSQQIVMMEKVGLYRGQIDFSRFVGLTIFIIGVMTIIMAYLYKLENRVYQDDLKLTLLALILLIALSLGKLAYYSYYLAGPVAAGALLAAILINPRVGLVVSVLMAVLYGIIVESDLRAVAFTLGGSMVGVYSVTKMAHGYSLIKTGFLIGLANFIIIYSMGMFMQIDGYQLLSQSVTGAIGGLASAIITTGLLPYLEYAFNITTPIKLLELGQSNQPLMQRLLLEAPGTYHHSVLIGNLAEAAADKIGADPVVVRVGAYYHDIGKIKRPYFFVENQFGGDNPHSKLSPTLSTLIITSHVKDGLDLCREYQLPKVISDIVAQHHGTLLASFFFKKASETEHGECVVEADFRYEGPKPQTKEAALIMIADACEAAVRSIGKPNMSRIEAMVRKVIRERLNDGQFDECNLTLKNLTVIGDVYIRILSGMFHSRIEYPESLKEIERKKNKNGNSIKQLPTGNSIDDSDGRNSEEGTK